MILDYTPAIIRNANLILSLVHSFQFKDLYGYETSNLFNASQQQMKTAKGFYDEYRKYQKNYMALEAHQLIQKWAKELKIEKYFFLIEENEYRSNPTQKVASQVEAELNNKMSFPLVGNQASTANKDSGQANSRPGGAAGVTDAANPSIPTLEKGGKGGFSDIQQEPAGQMAITMYCLSALEYFKDKDLEEIKKVGFEIAMLGRQGIDPAKTEKKYNLESIPGKEFTGLQLLAYMYSAFQVIDPFLDTGMNYKKEYEAAKGMFEKGKS